MGHRGESIKETARTAMEAGARKGPEGVPRDGRFAEVFILDPVGARVDLSEQGWKTQSGQAKKYYRRNSKLT